MQNNEITGVLLINKPAGITSYDCIRHIKRVLKPIKTKIGHAGTLDPFASGLLIVCIGRQATKNISNLLIQDKEYVVTAKLGELTDTLDLTGNILQNIDLTSSFTKQKLQEVFDNFERSYEQIPPIYSALKFEGQPLYELARNNKISQEELEKITEAKKRTVLIHSLDLLDFNLPFFTFKAHVSKGTYIRSLANDIAQQLGSVATTYELCRTKIGEFKLEDAVSLEELKTMQDLVEVVMAVQAA
jgi:tRNA pseudouridine55 synthase